MFLSIYKNKLMQWCLTLIVFGGASFVAPATLADGGAGGPDSGYIVGGKLSDLARIEDTGLEYIPSIDQDMRFKEALNEVVFPRLNQIAKLIPELSISLRSLLYSKRWYLANSLPQTQIDHERIGQQDNYRVLLLRSYVDENALSLGRLIFHELWVGYARWHWDGHHPSQKDVEFVSGHLLSLPEFVHLNQFNTLLVEYGFKAFSNPSLSIRTQQQWEENLHYLILNTRIDNFTYSNLRVDFAPDANQYTLTIHDPLINGGSIFQEVHSNGAFYLNSNMHQFYFESNKVCYYLVDQYSSTNYISSSQVEMLSILTKNPEYNSRDWIELDSEYVITPTQAKRVKSIVCPIPGNTSFEVDSQNRLQLK